MGDSSTKQLGFNVLGNIGASLVISLGTAIWAHVRHQSVDWYGIAGLFALTFVVFFFLIRMLRSRSSSKQGDRETSKPAEMGELKQSKQQPIPVPDTSLRARLIAKRDELALFVKKHGNPPPFDRRPGEEQADYLSRKWQELKHYHEPMAAEFRLKHADSVKRLRDEMQSRQVFSELGLNDAIQKAEGPTCDAETVEVIRGKLWDFAGLLDK